MTQTVTRVILRVARHRSASIPRLSFKCILDLLQSIFLFRSSPFWIWPNTHKQWTRISLGFSLAYNLDLFDVNTHRDSTGLNLTLESRKSSQNPPSLHFCSLSLELFVVSVAGSGCCALLAGLVVTVVSCNIDSGRSLSLSAAPTLGPPALS